MNFTLKLSWLIAINVAFYSGIALILYMLGSGAVTMFYSLFGAS